MTTEDKRKITALYCIAIVLLLCGVRVTCMNTNDNMAVHGIASLFAILGGVCAVYSSYLLNK